MPCVYVRTGAGYWHILRPHEQQLVWCEASLNGPSWTQSALEVPPESVCADCFRKVSASTASADDDDPSLGGTF
jgi:hypothetical protein